MLGQLRLGPPNLRGRKYPEPPHPYRNDFQRDRDRIIHSRAFRRMEGKTQVFGAGLHDHYRNRLTHTIEVSQVARTVASALGLNEEYTETLALAHDLGHPPFGHVGEKELNTQMQRYGGSFEHNRHALRIVDKLECRYARFDGLNLTFEVREGIAKHSRELASGDVEVSDLLPGLRPSLEAQLLDYADEIAYNIADIDDAVTGKLFTVDSIGERVPIFRELADTVDTQFPGLAENIRFWEVQRQVINILVGGLVDGTVAAARQAGVETVEDVRQLDHRLACMSDESLIISRQLRSLLVERVYSYAKLIEDRQSAVEQLRLLFEYLVEHPDEVSPAYRTHLEYEPAYRVVCDYIAGMTDAYLLRTAAGLLH